MALTDESNPQVISVEAGHALLPCSREKRNRRAAAYVIYDAKSGTQLIAQKLQHAAMYINRQLATAERERVTVQGLYEAADTSGNRVDGFHKMRYRIQRCDIAQAHEVFNQAARKCHNVQRSVVVTNSPEAYSVAVV